MSDSSEKLISVLVPVYNEADNIVPCLRGLWGALKDVPHEILICYDFDGDSTLPAIERMSDKPKTLRLVKNDLGRGVAFAMRAGFAAAKGDAIVTTMADLSDPPAVILEMAKKIRENGADVVSGSRYMKGGSQTGGPLFKRTLSRLAGLSLYYMAGVNTHDSTTNFRAYSSRFLKKVDVESIYGFELGLELTAKAHTMGFKVDEVPSSWVDRTAGESRFQLWKWMPRYLYWYWCAAAKSVFVWSVMFLLFAIALRFIYKTTVPVPQWDELTNIPYFTGQTPVTWEWLWSQHNEHRIVIPRIMYLVVSWLFNDMRAVCYFSAALMFLSASILVVRARQLRGQTEFTDAFFGLALLNMGHSDNLCYPFQIQFTASTATLLVLFSLYLSASLETRARAVIFRGVLLLSLPLYGGQGVIVAPFMALLELFHAVHYFRQRNVLIRPLAGISIAFSVATMLLIAVVLMGAKANHLAWSPSLFETLKTTAHFMGVNLGYFGVYHLWPLSFFVVCGILFLAFNLALRSVRSPQNSRFALSILLLFAAIGVLSIIISHGRATLGAGAGGAPRYGYLAVPALIGAQFALILFLPKYISRFAQFCMLVLFLVALVPNHLEAKNVQNLRVAILRELQNDAKAGVAVEALNAKYSIHVYPDPVVFTECFKMLEKTETGPYKE